MPDVDNVFASTILKIKYTVMQALVNSGNCCFALAMAPGGERDEHLSEAWTQYEAALRQEPDCVEAIYNMGLVAKAMEQYDLALEQLIMLNGMIANQVMGKVGATVDRLKIAMHAVCVHVAPHTDCCRWKYCIKLQIYTS